jgi:hypothetical protein
LSAKTTAYGKESETDRPFATARDETWRLVVEMELSASPPAAGRIAVIAYRRPPGGADAARTSTTPATSLDVTLLKGC